MTSSPLPHRPVSCRLNPYLLLLCPQARAVEDYFVGRWTGKGLKAPPHLAMMTAGAGEAEVASNAQQQQHGSDECTAKFIFSKGRGPSPPPECR